jgi:PAS domain-containing protein
MRNGRCLCAWLAVIQDVTSRKEAEKALRASEARFVKAFQARIRRAMCITTIQAGAVH